MSTNTVPTLGVIEGFYGKSYSESERAFLLNFLQQHNYQFYIYAPKEDKQLRDEWQKDITCEYKNHLKFMQSQCQKAHVDFGIALSPLNLTKNFHQEKDILLKQVKTLCEYSQCDIFCLLFDDMFKDAENIGAVQNEIIHLVDQNLPQHVKRFIVCPTYYSFDSTLEKIFGTRPEHYFSEFTHNLSQRVEIFWTGEKVLSKDYTLEHIEQVSKLLGRKPFIWDNYPVNDGKNICHFLYLNRFKGRRNLSSVVSGHAVNPMVQCVLSTLPLISLPLIYQDLSDEKINAAHLNYAKALFGKAAHELLRKVNFELLTKVGLNKMSAQDKARLMEFAHLDQNAALDELIDFLNISQRFDQSIVSGNNPVCGQS